MRDKSYVCTCNLAAEHFTSDACFPSLSKIFGNLKGISGKKKLVGILKIHPLEHAHSLF